jgi:hypothetical protein
MASISIMGMPHRGNPYSQLLGRRPWIVSILQERLRDAFFCGEITDMTTSPRPQRYGRRHPQRDVSHPNFFIPGRLLVGAQPLQSFLCGIQGELARAW